MNTLIAIVIIAAWCGLVWSIDRCIKTPTIYDKHRRDE